MDDAILNDKHRKAELSFAYLHALAAQAGYTCQPGPRPDVDSIDAIIKSGDRSRTQLDVQLKATSTPRRRDDGLHFKLQEKHYNDLCADRSVPLILVVLVLPPDEAQWLECTTEALTIRRCGWWESLSGREPIGARSKTITIPTNRRIGPRGIKAVMAHVKGENP